MTTISKTKAENYFACYFFLVLVDVHSSGETQAENYIFYLVLSFHRPILGFRHIKNVHYVLNKCELKIPYCGIHYWFDREIRCQNESRQTDKRKN